MHPDRACIGKHNENAITIWSVLVQLDNNRAGE
jgi:hypothetical protein